MSLPLCAPALDALTTATLWLAGRRCCPLTSFISVSPVLQAGESQILALDSTIGKQMDDIFMEDLKYSDEIKLETFRKRPWTGKVLEWGAQQMRRVL